MLLRHSQYHKSHYEIKQLTTPSQASYSYKPALALPSSKPMDTNRIKKWKLSQASIVSGKKRKPTLNPLKNKRKFILAATIGKKKKRFLWKTQVVILPQEQETNQKITSPKIQIFIINIETNFKRDDLFM